MPFEEAEKFPINNLLDEIFWVSPGMLLVVAKHYRVLTLTEVCKECPWYFLMAHHRNEDIL